MTVGGFGWEFLFLFSGLIVSAISLIFIPISFLFKFSRFSIIFLFNIHGVICVGHSFLFLKILKNFFDGRGDSSFDFVFLWALIGFVYFFLFIMSICMHCRGRYVSNFYYYSTFISCGISPFVVIVLANSIKNLN